MVFLHLPMLSVGALNLPFLGRAAILVEEIRLLSLLILFCAWSKMTHSQGSNIGFPLIFILAGAIQSV